MSRLDVPFEFVLRAAKDNDSTTMSELIKLGASPTASNAIRQTGLHVAAIWGHVEVSDVLLRAGANVNARNQFGITPLHMAAQNSHEQVAKLLLEWGADVSCAADGPKKRTW